jgi:hypothetical protein
MIESPESAPEKMQINIADQPWIECSEKNKVFSTKLMFKRISPMISKSGKEEHVPMEVVVCEKCGKVPSFFPYLNLIPDDMKSECK